MASGVVMAALALSLAGCGLAVQSPDLFVMTRAGPGHSSTLLVNDAGTIRCDGSAPRSLPDSLLLTARDLATSLTSDVKSRLRLAPPAAGSVYRFRVQLQAGTLRFPDTAAAHHKELAQAELFAVQALQGPCAGH
ncbi:MAG: hypothetical protein ACYC91_04700 [Solirubrobacteraceae bacterium]